MKIKQRTRHWRAAARSLTVGGLAAVMLATLSCNSFLDPDPKDILAPENFYKSSSDAVAAVNAVYEQVKWTHWLAYWYLSDIASDDIVASANFGSDGHRMADYTFDASEWVFGDVWRNSYVAINRANGVIERVPGIDAMDATLRDRVIGEAKFLRAYSYFNLVRFFGDVPLITAEVKSLTGLDVSRTPAAEVYAQIESDLQAAATSLPPSYSGPDVGRATSGAAEALLAKVYLNEQKWNEAAEAAGNVISSARYSLLPVWRDNFRVSTELTNSESIFEINYDGTLDPGAGSVHTLFTLPQNYPGGDAYGLTYITPSLVSLFAPADTRGNHGTFMVSPYTDEDGRTVTWAMPPGPAIAKWLDESSTQNMNSRAWGSQPNNWIVLRYADVLLMYAEAVNQGGTAGAMTRDAALNEVRQRAGLDAVAGLGQDAFRDSLRVERRREFVFEGQRWFDLSRWGALNDAIMAKTTEIAAIAPGETTPHGAPSNLFPIPRGEMDLNPNLTQNPGW